QPRSAAALGLAHDQDGFVETGVELAEVVIGLCFPVGLLNDGIAVIGGALFTQVVRSAATSSSLTKGHWTRRAPVRPLSLTSISPLPSSTSAPCSSRMVRLSTFCATRKAMREGKFALIIPVMTSTLGRCVASTTCMPAARAF